MSGAGLERSVGLLAASISKSSSFQRTRNIRECLAVPHLPDFWALPGRPRQIFGMWAQPNQRASKCREPAAGFEWVRVPRCLSAAPDCVFSVPVLFSALH